MRAVRRLGSRVLALLRGSLWPVPLLAVTVAVVLGVLMPRLDEAVDSGDPGHPLAFVFGGGPAAARDLLAAIAGSLISVTGLTFSLTVVALQLGSSQYSPRLLQTFASDRVVKYTLAQLIGTFVYALTVLRTVRTAEATDGEDAFVPRLSISLAYLATLGSVAALVLFLGHLARSLRVETMLRDVHDEGRATWARALPADADEEPPGTASGPTGTPAVLTARGSGFVVAVDEESLVAAARDAGVVLQLVPRVGDSVVEGTPVAHAWQRPGSPAEDLSGLERAVQRGVRLAYEREPDRDVAYSLRKVVDIAGRALSPGINDPTTAVHALSHVSAILGELVSRPARARRHHDGDGELRLVVPQWGHRELLELGLDEPIQYASGQPAVLRRIAALLREVAWRAPRERLSTDLRQLMDRVAGVARESTAIGATEIRSWRTDLDEALAGRWPPGS
ncbi:DUF2254 domain-containing protein [Trujillonella humicola]|uniref:DUF2254 domain-containing protein n=1 Tax=Trujillonella humicola TaxID=3383699 RepID=UPI00390579DD